MRAVNLTTGKEVAGDVTVAKTLWLRTKGLLGRKKMEAGEALLIMPCKGIHTFGMKFAIDVIFFDRKNRVVAVRRDVLPNRLSPVYLSAAGVLELPSGSLDGSAAGVGDELEIA